MCWHVKWVGSSRCHSNPFSLKQAAAVQQTNLVGTVSGCERWGHSVNQSFSHCSLLATGEFTGGSALPSRGVWNLVCLLHSGLLNSKAPERENVFCTLLRKPLFLCLFACLCVKVHVVCYTALAEHISHFEIKIVNTLWRLWHRDHKAFSPSKWNSRDILFVKTGSNFLITQGTEGLFCSPCLSGLRCI